MKNIKLAITLTSLLLVSLNIEAKDYQGRSCELDGATTESGEQVTGECYMYSDQYGELEGAQTESGKSVSGECYFY